MIKLTNLINELGINKPNITSLEVYNLWDKCVKAKLSDSNFIEIFEQYGYNVGEWVSEWLNSLHPSILNKIYYELQSKSGLNELNVNNTRVTPEIVYDFIKKIPKGDKFDDYWNKAEPIYNKYGRPNHVGSSLSKFIANLNTRDLSLLYSDLKKAFPDNITESQQITAQSILDYWDTKMQSRPKVDWNKFNQIKTKYFGKDKYVGLMDLEDNLDNHPLQPEQLANLYSDLQKLFKLNELNVSNTRVTPEMVKDYYKTYIQRSDVFSDLWKEYLKISKVYCIKYNIDSFIATLDDFEQLSYPDLVQIYKEMQELIQKYTINELEINKPPINLIPGKKYLINISSPGYKERWEVYKFSSEHMSRLTFIKPNNTCVIDIGKENLFKDKRIKPYKEINELSIGNNKIDRFEVLKYWEVYVNVLNPNYRELRNKYAEKYLEVDIEVTGTYLIRELPLPALTKFYYELKKIFGEPINELGISNSNKSVDDIIDLYHNKLLDTNGTLKARKIFIEYGRDDHTDLHLINWLKLLDQSTLNQIYNQLTALIKNE